MIEAMLNAIKVRATGDKSAGSVYDRVNGRIYSPAAPDNTKYPCIVFLNQGASRREGYGFAHHEMSVRFIVYTDDKFDHTTAVKILDAIEDRFAWQSLTVSGGTTVMMAPGMRIGPERVAEYITAAQDYDFVVEE